MIFEGTDIDGVYVVRVEWRQDERGAFGRVFCEEEFRAAGLDPHVAQCGTSKNPALGTVRGLHLQRDPHGETKLVRCTAGAVFDVAVDLRRGSPSFGHHHSVRLSPENDLALLMPPGVAHGFMSLEPDSDVFYQMSAPYEPGASTGVRWDDPELAIPWPELSDLVISDRDRTLPLLRAWSDKS